MSSNRGPKKTVSQDGLEVCPDGFHSAPVSTPKTTTPIGFFQQPPNASTYNNSRAPASTLHSSPAVHQQHYHQQQLYSNPSYASWNSIPGNQPMRQPHHQQPRYGQQQQNQQQGLPTRPPKRARLTTPDRSSSTHNKESKDTSAPNPQFFCQACQLQLDSLSAYQAHVQSHTKCAQCSFTAAPKVVKAHYQAAHGKFSGSGFKTITVAVPGCPLQKFSICVGNRPEDVRAWIAQRKKKFPRQQVAKSDKANEKQSPEKAPAKESASLSSLLAGYGSSSSEDEGDNDKDKSSPENQQDVVANEHDKSENIDNQNAVESENNKPAADPITKPKPMCHAFAKFGTCRRGDACPYSHDPNQVKPQQQQQQPPKQQRGTSSSKKTLLRKLLGKEMERETALTVSLLKYIVESNFLTNTGNDQDGTGEDQDIGQEG